ncbi:universal stress protein [Streptomyces sp. col6]|uniref:universal stress protein n=1 Tax=Streptomyces sp. col6 TaxID=2478958 RepID=UPI0011CE8FE1|nr:universal stress protein [Streptomyces sp. col6]TXS00579.1 universal stress protein [Streptomyces sp. col6]
MKMPLVVGVDGSGPSFAALDWAVDEALRHGLALRVVHASLWERYEGVVPARSVDRPSGQVFAENVVATAAERARRRAPDIEIVTDVRAEDAAGALLSEAGEATAVVVGSRGRGEWAGLLLGSVGLVVAARSPGPVVVVRGGSEALEGRHGRVLLGLGDHDQDSPALRFAFREAAARDAELDVVRAWRRPAHEPAAHPLLAGEGSGYHEGEAAALLDEVLDPVARENPGVRLRRSTVEGVARRVLTERSSAADLLVVGARRRRGLVGLELGRVAHRTLHHALCPVAVVPQENPGTTETEGDPS